PLCPQGNAGTPLGRGMGAPREPEVLFSASWLAWGGRRRSTSAGAPPSGARAAGLERSRTRDASPEHPRGLSARGVSVLPCVGLAWAGAPHWHATAPRRSAQ